MSTQEEQNRGKPNWEHLNEDLHVLITVEDSQARAEIKMRRAVEEVKKLLVPAVSTRRGSRPNPNAALWRRSSPSRCRASCLLPHVRSKRTGCRAHAAIRGEKQAGASLREPHFISTYPWPPAPSRAVPPLMSAGIFLAPPLISPRWP